MRNARPVLRGNRLHTAWVGVRVLAQLVDEAEVMAPLETGGVLMGYSQAVDVVITDWIGPGPKAKHEIAFFEPDYDFQEREIARIYQTSGRVTTYLGDWHTHPNGGLALSTIDRRTLAKIGRHSTARNKQPLMMILAGRDNWTFGIWSSKQSFASFLTKPKQLEIKTYESG